MIRKLDKQDVQNYKKLRLQALQTDPENFFSTFEEASKLSDYSFESELLHQTPPLGYYGYIKDDLQAYISLQLPYFARQSHVLELFNLYVDPKLRKQGIGKALVLHCLELAKARGTETIFLSVMAHNAPAIMLYTSLGFAPYGRKERSLKIDDHYVDEVLMRLDF